MKHRFDFVHSEIPFNLAHPHLHAAPLPATLPPRVYAARGTMVIDSSLIRGMGLLPAGPAEEEVHTVPGQRAASRQGKLTLSGVAGQSD